MTNPTSNRLTLAIQSVLKRFDHTPTCACRDCSLMSELDAAFKASVVETTADAQDAARYRLIRELMTKTSPISYYSMPHSLMFLRGVCDAVAFDREVDARINGTKYEEPLTEETSALREERIAQLNREIVEHLAEDQPEKTPTPLLHADMSRDGIDAAMRQVRAAKSIERCAICGMPPDRHGDRHPFQSNGA